MNENSRAWFVNLCHRPLIASVGRLIGPNRIRIIGIATALATTLLAWQGYKAVLEWRRSTELVVEQSVRNTVTLIKTALSRDMRAVARQALPGLEPVIPHWSDPDDFADDVAAVFLRFPYAESFFSWTPAGKNGVLYVFNRSDRLPGWCHSVAEKHEYLITVLRNPAELADMHRILQKQSSSHAKFLVFETNLVRSRYQIIARRVYGGAERMTLQGIVGFTVNMEWVRSYYFSEMVRQFSTLLGTANTMTVEVLDESRGLVATNDFAHPYQDGSKGGVYESQFSLSFFDPVIRASTPDLTLPSREWTIRGRASPDALSLSAANGASKTFALISLATVVALAALALAVHAAHTAAALAAMKSEFVSAITHELKTPLSTIQLTCETLARGRFRSNAVMAEYTELLLNEVARLKRMIKNVITISRLKDVHTFYNFEVIRLDAVLEEVLSSFRLQLQARDFELSIDLADDLPAARADHAAVVQVLDNLIDNAIRYSEQTRHLMISTDSTATHVTLRIADRGQGIPPDEMAHVFKEFFRGRNAASGGSGLGLAIVRQIMQAHNGDVKLQSTIGMGTVAEIILPAA